MRSPQLSLRAAAAAGNTVNALFNFSPTVIGTHLYTSVMKRIVRITICGPLTVSVAEFFTYIVTRNCVCAHARFCVWAPVIPGSRRGRTESQTLWLARWFCQWCHAAAEAAWFRTHGSHNGPPSSTYGHTHTHQDYQKVQGNLDIETGKQTATGSILYF